MPAVLEDREISVRLAGLTVSFWCVALRFQGCGQGTLACQGLEQGGLSVLWARGVNVQASPLSHHPVSKCLALIPELSEGEIPEHLSSGPCLVGGWGREEGRGLRDRRRRQRHLGA